MKRATSAARALMAGLYPPTNEVMRAEDRSCSSCAPGEGQLLHEYPSTDFRMCRICLESDAPDDDPLIAPCRCAGSMQWVHRMSVYP